MILYYISFISITKPVSFSLAQLFLEVKKKMKILELYNKIPIFIGKVCHLSTELKIGV